MYRKPNNDQEIFLENIARKVWLQLSYAHAVEESLLEASIKHLIVEEIDRKELEKLENLAKEASQAIDDMISDASTLGFEKTIKYLSQLKKSLPGTLSLVKMSLTGDAEKMAKEIGKITTTTTKINNVRDSFYDAVILFGSQLAKLPYSQNPEEAASEAAAAAAAESGSGEVEVDDGKTVSPEEATKQAVRAFKDSPLEDIAANKFMTWVKGIKFPDEGMLRKAAEDAYKPAPEPKGFLGKVAKFFGFKTLSPSDFADDLLTTSLAKLIDAAEQLKAKQKEAEEKEKESVDFSQTIQDDVQDLAQGDDSALGVTGPGGGGGGGSSATATIQMPGAGPVPAQQIQQVTPGKKIDSPEDAKGKRMVPMPDLQKKVTAPEDMEEMTDELAALINDDPKSEVIIFDPEKAEEAAEEAGEEAETAEEKPTQKTKPEDITGKKEESWVHRQSLGNLLFESAHTRKTTRWAHKSSLSRELLGEAIMYKDLQKALQAQGVPEGEMESLAQDLAFRLENQYDVIIKGIPVPEELEQAAEQVTGYTAEEVEARLAQEREFWAQRSDEDRKWAAEFMAARDEAERERLMLQKPPTVIVNNEMNQHMHQGAEFVNAGPPPGEVDTSGVEDEKEKPGKPRDRTKPPTDKIKERGKEVGLEPKEGETGEQFGKRVRKEEEAQGKRKPKKKKKKPKKKPESSGSTKMSQSASQSAKTTVATGFGTFHENAYYKSGRLLEVLLGPRCTQIEDAYESSNTTNRWLELAGLEED